MKATRQDIINYIEAFRGESFQGSFRDWFTKDKSNEPEIVAGKAEYNTPLPPFQPDIRGINLREIDLKGIDLTLANFSGSTLTLADFTGADLGGSVFHGADLTGSYFQNASLILASFEKADATIADFSGAKLPGADFSEANLTDADFNDAHLRGAKFGNANLTGTAFIRAELGWAVFDNAIFAKTDFTEAKLSETVFIGKTIAGAIITNADLTDVRFKLSPVRKVDMDGSSTEEEPEYPQAPTVKATVSFHELPSPVWDDKSSSIKSDVEHFRMGSERNVSANDMSVIGTVDMSGRESPINAEWVTGIKPQKTPIEQKAGTGWTERVSQSKTSSRSSSESLVERLDDTRRQSLYADEYLKGRQDTACCVIL